ADPAPTPLPLFRFVSFGLIVFLGILQLLPATHFRHPNDPHRNWFPIENFMNESHSFSPVGKLGASGGENAEVVTSNYEEDGMVHVVSWMECLDLRLLAVLANSTLTSSRNPDLVYFHFFIPGGSEDKLSFYKLKVLFPNSHLEIHGQQNIKELIRNAMFPLEPNFEELAPFAIPMILQSLAKFIYFSSNLVVKGRAEELISLDLQNHGIAAAEDCSKRLTDHVNPEVLDAIQRSASRPWVSETPYEKNACVPDLSVLLIDARNLRKDFLQGVSWWTTVLNWSQSAGEINPALFLTLYHHYSKLSSSWLSIGNKALPESTAGEMVIPYDGPKKLCSALGAGSTLQHERGDLWKQYLPPMSSQMLGR
ncbi:Hexosyltransferase, partial [Psidium guajava]